MNLVRNCTLRIMRRHCCLCPHHRRSGRNPESRDAGARRHGGQSRRTLGATVERWLTPPKWLGPHELLMTVGLCVPTVAEEQAAFVARLDDAGLAGMMIGDHAPGPMLSDAMFAEADRRDFPILLAGALISYAVVARHVGRRRTPPARPCKCSNSASSTMSPRARRTRRPRLCTSSARSWGSASTLSTQLPGRPS